MLTRRLQLPLHKRILYSLIVAIFVLALVEVLSFFVDGWLYKKGVFYTPVEINYSEYMEKRDPILGWPLPQNYDDKNRDEIGARRSPAFPDPAKAPAMASLYGDSYTWSEGVDHEHAWGNVLAKLIGARVNNFGVSGYGSDQACLRFEHNVHDDARIVILCHLTENILRNVNQFRNLLYPSISMGFKPRFVLDKEGELELVPIPTFNETDFRACIERPGDYLTHEWFLPRGSAGIQMLSFPYFLSLCKGFAHFHVQSALRGEPWYASFYQEDHPSRALQVTEGIICRFTEKAHNKGRTPVVVILPTGRDLQYYQKHQCWVYKNLLDRLKKSNIEFLDLGPPMFASMGDKSILTFYGNISGHPNKEGYALIARLVFQYLKTKGYLASVPMSAASKP